MKDILFWVGLTVLAFQDLFKKNDVKTTKRQQFLQTGETSQYFIEGVEIGKIYDISRDVDLIYTLCFKDGVEKIKRTGKVDYNTFNTCELDSSILLTETSRKAHRKNPVSIVCNSLGNYFSNFYSPSEQKIALGISSTALDFAVNSLKGKIEDAVNYLEYYHYQGFLSEFEEHKIKGTIQHELAHWIDDTLYKGFLKKFTEKAQQKRDSGKSVSEARRARGLPMNASSIEIQAQIHAIEQAKRKFSDIWDDLYLDDLFVKIPSLRSIYLQLNEKERKIWLKKLRSRMSREGLLGEKMIYKIVSF